MGNTPSEPGQPTPPKPKGPGGCDMKGWRLDECEECGHQWWRLDYVRSPMWRCPMCTNRDRAAAEGSDSKMEAPSRTPEQNG